MCIFTHVSHMLNICLTCVVLNMCLTHVDIFPVYKKGHTRFIEFWTMHQVWNILLNKLLKSSLNLTAYN